MSENNIINNNNRNLDIQVDSDGSIITNDAALNDIIKQVEEENNGKLVGAMPVFISEGPDPTTKVYLILLFGYDSEDDGYEYRDWEVIIGRQETYNRLKNLIESDAIDPLKSFVLSGNTEPEKAITVYRFMKHCIDNDRVVDNSSFDINEYTTSTDGMVDNTILDV